MSESLGVSVKKFLPLGEHLYTDLNRVFGLNNILTVFDVGANIGQSVVAYRKHFSNATVYSFEPGIDTFAQLQANVGLHSNVRLYNMGLGAEETTMKMIKQHRSSLNSLKAERNQGEGEFEMVTIRTLDRFIQEEKIKSIDFMKIDTEGFEMEVLKGAEQVLASGIIGAVQLELGFNKKDHRTTYFNTVNELLQDYGFAALGFYDQSPNKPHWNFKNTPTFCSSTSSDGSNDNRCSSHIAEGSVQRETKAHACAICNGWPDQCRH